MDVSTLRTERLVMLPLSSSDIDEIAALYADIEVMRHVAYGIKNRPQSTDALLASERSWEVNGWGPWAIRDAETGGLLGEGGIRPFAELPDSVAKFGITLGRRSWGTGIADEAGKAILDDAWTRFPSDRIHATVQPDATSDSTVLRGLGFVTTGVSSVHGTPHHIWVTTRPE